MSEERARWLALALVVVGCGTEPFETEIPLPRSRNDMQTNCSDGYCETVEMASHFVGECQCSFIPSTGELTGSTGPGELDCWELCKTRDFCGGRAVSDIERDGGCIRLESPCNVAELLEVAEDEPPHCSGESLPAKCYERLEWTTGDATGTTHHIDHEFIESEECLQLKLDGVKAVRACQENRERVLASCRKALGR